MNVERFAAWDSAVGARRTIVLGITLWMTWRSFLWAAEFATLSKFDGSGTALVIGAVLVPIAALQTFVFRIYSESKS